nr:MAG TPA_asm: hypothetical protein [Caudoviricetes sp.]
MCRPRARKSEALDTVKGRLYDLWRIPLAG